jgi:D-alanyl-D-alanine carboxypeptidase/D-alanyl-D-alanine-endopeptidase (penicillin-binding protein 4)
VTPSLVNDLLVLVDADYGSFKTILSGMPVAGSGGSLGSRLTEAGGQITAKTGWIRTGYSLAGFADSPDGSKLIFTVYNLGFVSISNREAMDNLVLAIYNCGGELGNE